MHKQFGNLILAVGILLLTAALFLVSHNMAEENRAEAAVGEVMPKENVRVRVPLISGYNDERCTEKSANILKNMGYDNVEMFKYVIR